MYDELIKRLRCGNLCVLQMLNLMDEAADVIEDLSAERNANYADSWKMAFEIERDAHRWIPVTERLPEPCETVLAFRVFGMHGQLSEVCFAHTLKMFGRINWSMVGVTHWMPLPESPQEENNG